jgi:hypothetical protein
VGVDVIVVVDGDRDGDGDEQLRRAALSVPLSIAEAAGRTQGCRCSEALRHCTRIGQLASRVVAMLTMLCR